MASEMFAALLEPPVPVPAHGSNNRLSTLLASDAFWIVAAGLAIFLLLTLMVWLHHRRKARLQRGGERARERTGSRRREKRRPITIAQSGGLPPLRSDHTPSIPSRDASQ